MPLKADKFGHGPLVPKITAEFLEQNSRSNGLFAGRCRLCSTALTHQMFGNQRTILRSFWTHALLWSAAFLGYHCLIAAIKPKIGDIDWRTFPLYANVVPVWSPWAIVPLLTFGGWLATLCWFWRRKSRSVPIVVAIAFVVALNVTTAMTRGGAPALWRPFTPIQPEAKNGVFRRHQPGGPESNRVYSQLHRDGADVVAPYRHAPARPRSLSLGGVACLWQWHRGSSFVRDYRHGVEPLSV